MCSAQCFEGIPELARDFSLDGWTIRPQRGCIERNGSVVRIKPKPMAVLELLVAAGGEVVTRNEFFEVVWPGAVISDATLSQCIVELRHAFGETARDARIIKTIPKVGFRLGVPVESVEPQGEQGVQLKEPFVPRKPSPAWSLVFMAVFFGIVALTWYFGNGGAGQTEPAVGGIRAVAVLPFADMSPDQDQGHFADGLTEELINQLAQVHGLAVTGRTSSFQYKGKSVDLREVGETLGVEYVLEGSIRKSTDDLRITAQLIETESGFHTWSENYVRPLRDFIEIQEEISRSVATALKIKLNVAAAGSPHATTSLEAYELVMRAKEYGKDMRLATMKQREEYLLKATEIDPDYAYAWAFLAQLYHIGNEKLSWNWREQSEEWLSRALALEPDSPWVLEFAAYVYVAMQKWTQAEQAIARLSELNNTNVGSPQLELMVKAGHAEDSLALGERAIRRDPLSRHFQTYLQHAYAMNGRVDEALDLSETFYRNEHDIITVIEGMITSFSHPDPEKLDSWLSRMSGFADEGGFIREIASFWPDRKAALDWLRDTEIRSPAARYVAPAWAAYLGDPELALGLMKQAPDLWTFWMPHNKDVRRLPGFKSLVMELGLVDYWREFGWGDFCRPVGEDFECE